jgi:hypothetical protein
VFVFEQDFCYTDDEKDMFLSIFLDIQNQPRLIVATQSNSSATSILYFLTKSRTISDILTPCQDFLYIALFGFWGGLERLNRRKGGKDE